MTKTFKTSVIFFLTAAWLVLMRIAFGEANLSDNVSEWLFSFVVQVVGLGAMPVLLYKFWVKEDIKTGFAFNAKINPLIYVIAVVVGFTLHILISCVSVIWQNITILTGYVPTNSPSTIYSGPEVLIMEILATAILPGICEEITYRGIGVQVFENVEDEKTKILMTALLFGLGHQFILQTGYAFVAGMVLGYLAVKTRSIFPGMIVHFLNNFLSVISGYSDQKGGSYHAFEEALYNTLFANWGMILLTMVIMSAVTYGLLMLAKKLTAEKNEENIKEGVYYYPKTVQYVDEIFGKPFHMDAKINTKRTRWYEYAFLYGAFALMTTVTIMSYMWGAMR